MPPGEKQVAPRRVVKAAGVLQPPERAVNRYDFVYREDLKSGVNNAKDTARKGDTASKAAIAQDFQNVMGHKNENWKATYFKVFTLLDLPTADVDKLFYQRVSVFEQNLGNIFPAYDSFPAPAQLALLDIIYNKGRSGLIHFKKGKFLEAASKRDWSTASLICDRPEVAARRNTRTKELFQQAADVEKVLQQHKTPTGKVMPPRVLTQPHAWYDPVFDVLEEVYQKLKSELLPPRAQGKR